MLPSSASCAYPVSRVAIRALELYPAPLPLFHPKKRPPLSRQGRVQPIPLPHIRLRHPQRPYLGAARIRYHLHAFVPPSRIVTVFPVTS